MVRNTSVTTTRVSADWINRNSFLVKLNLQVVEHATDTNIINVILGEIQYDTLCEKNCSLKYSVIKKEELRMIGCYGESILQDSPRTHLPEPDGTLMALFSFNKHSYSPVW